MLSDPKRLRTRRGHGYLVSWKHRLRTSSEPAAAAIVERLLEDETNVESLRAALGRPEASLDDLAEWLVTGLASGSLDLLKTRVNPPVLDAPPETDLTDLLPPPEPKRDLDSLTFEVVDQDGEGIAARYQVHAPSGDPSGSLPPGERRFVGDLEDDAHVEVELSAVQLPLRDVATEPTEPVPLGPGGTEPEPTQPEVVPVGPGGVEPTTPSDAVLSGPLWWIEFAAPRVDVFVEGGALLLPRTAVPALAALFQELDGSPRQLVVATHGGTPQRPRAMLTGALVSGDGWAAGAAAHHTARELAAFLRWVGDEFGLGSAPDESELEERPDGSSSDFSDLLAEPLADFREDFNAAFAGSLPDGAHPVSVNDWEALEQLIMRAIADRLAAEWEVVESHRSSLEVGAAVDCGAAAPTPEIQNFQPRNQSRVDLLAFEPGVGIDLTDDDVVGRVYAADKLSARRLDFVADYREHPFDNTKRAVEVVVHDALGRPLPGVSVRHRGKNADSVATTASNGLATLELGVDERHAEIVLPDYSPRALEDLAPVLDKPTPGAFYRIRPGDTLLGTTGEAYGLGEGASRLNAAKAVSNNPWNRHYHVLPASDFTKKHFPGGIVSFMPRWEGNIASEQDAGKPGNSFALIFFPESPQ